MLSRVLFRSRIAFRGSFYCTSNTPSTVDPGEVALANEAARQSTNEDIDWTAAMERIHAVEAAFPLPRPTDEERQDVVARTVTYNLAKVANDSETVRGLLDLGIKLWRWEEFQPGMVDMAMTMDLERDVLPTVRFLMEEIGLTQEQMATVLTRNGKLLQADLDDLRTRVNYLTDKGFTMENVAAMVSTETYWLNDEVTRVDGRLGWLQNHFSLTDENVRKVAVKCPKLILWAGLPAQLSLNSLVLKDFGGLTQPELRKLLIDCPEIFMNTREERISTLFGFLVDEVGYSKELVLKFPKTMTVQFNKVRHRPKFLQLFERNQFDPKEPNYVSPEMLILSEQKEFCEDVARVPERVYEKFLKTI